MGIGYFEVEVSASRGYSKPMCLRERYAAKQMLPPSPASKLVS
jgi:hypothetical protein